MKRAVTSSSNLVRRKLCPGSGRLEAGIPEKNTPESEEGTMLHALYRTGRRPDTLTPDQREALDLADFYTEEYFGKVRDTLAIPIDAPYIDEKEVFLELRDPAGRVVMPGHADLIRNWLPPISIRSIADAKFGVTEVEEAADNLQLASYAAQRHQQGAVDVTTVAIIQPRNFGPRVSEAMYVQEALPRVANEIISIVQESEKPDAPLIAGEKQCMFCKAKEICEAYKAKFLGLETIIRGEISEAVDAMTVDQLIYTYQGIAFAKKIDEPVSARMRREIEAGTITEYKLQNAGEKKTLIRTLELFDALKHYFADTDTPLTAAEFDDCREMAWGKLIALIQSKTGLAEKKAKEFLEGFLGDKVNRMPIAKRIVKAKLALK